MEAVGRLAAESPTTSTPADGHQRYTEVLLDKLNPTAKCRKGPGDSTGSRSGNHAYRNCWHLGRKLTARTESGGRQCDRVRHGETVASLIGETIELTTRLTPEVGHTRADAGQLEQVIMNLVVNARMPCRFGGKNSDSNQPGGD